VSRMEVKVLIMYIGGDEAELTKNAAVLFIEIKKKKNEGIRCKGKDERVRYRRWGRRKNCLINNLGSPGLTNIGGGTVLGLV